MLRCLSCFWLHSSCVLPGGHACCKPYFWDEWSVMLLQEVCRLHPYSGCRHCEHRALPLLLGNWWWRALCWAVPNIGTESDQQLRETASEQPCSIQTRAGPCKPGLGSTGISSNAQCGLIRWSFRWWAALRRRFCSCEKCCCCWKGWPAWSEADMLDRRLMSPQTKHIAPGVSICGRSAGQMLGEPFNFTM